MACRKTLLMYKVLVLIRDIQMVDVEMRKLVFCFVIKMRDDGVGAEEEYYEKVRTFWMSVQDLSGNRRKS